MYPNSITNVPSPSASPRLLEGGRRNDQDARGRRVTAGGTARAPDELETREAEPRTTADTFIPHVSLINLACILHVSCMYPRTSADTCIPHGSRMDPACISHVSRMYPSCISRAFLRAGVPTLPELQRRAKTMKRARTAAVHLDQLIDLKHLALSYFEPMPAP
jgi:hypothetical protein